MRVLIYLMIWFVLLTSCDPSSDPERHLLKTSVSIPEKYKVLDFNNDWSVGESSENYKLLISPKDYRTISNEIKGMTFFQQLDTSTVPIYALDNNTNMRKINETACWYDNKYFYQIFRPDPGVLITVILEKDSLMSVGYEDL